MRKYVDIPERGDTWRAFAFLIAKGDAYWTDYFVRAYLGGDKANTPRGMVDDIRELKACMRDGRPLPEWMRRKTIAELEAEERERHASS